MNNTFSSLECKRNKIKSSISKNNLFFVVLTLFYFISLVSSQPDYTYNYFFEEGYEIIDTPQETLYINTDYQYNFFLVNSSNGKRINGNEANCSFYIQNTGGKIVFEEVTEELENGFFRINITGESFKEKGVYSYGVYCSDGVGGAKSGKWEIIKEPSLFIINFENNSFNMVLLISFLILGGFLFTKKMYNYSAIIYIGSGLILLFSGENYFISSIIIIVGVIIAFINE